MDALAEPDSLYYVLGVERTARPEEITLAYYSQVRSYPPRQHPEFFQALNTAYQVLGDPAQRAAYDQESANGRRVRVLVDQAAIATNRDPQKAMSLLKSAVILAPDMVRPRTLLAQVLMRLQDYTGAERQYRWLLKRTPGNEILHFRLAHSLWLQEKLDAAEEEIEEVLRINSRYHDAVALLSRIYASREDLERQAEALERAIANDGTENFADFDAFLDLLFLYDRTNHAEAFAQALPRFLAILPPARVVAIALDLLERAVQQIDGGDAVRGKTLLKLASRIPLPPEATEAAQQIAQTLKRQELALAAQPIPDDNLLTGGLKSCFLVLYQDRSKDLIRKSRMDLAFAQIQRELDEDPRGLIQQIEYLHREYPGLAEDQNAFLTELRARAQRRIESRAAAAENAQPEAAPQSQPATEPEPPRRKGFLDRLLGRAA